MARLWRVEYAGACYHVINRGNYRQNLFVDQGAAEAFEKALGEAASRFHWKIHAYVIMRNHFHLALELTEPNLSVGMQWLQSTWARRYNNYRNITGRPFQGRYKALHVEPGESLARVCDYIHLNPVRAGIVEVEQLGEYRFCSYFHFRKSTRPSWLCSDTILLGAGELADTDAGWSNYLVHLSLVRGTEKDRRDLQCKYSRTWCIGSHAFKQKVKSKAAEVGCSQGACVFPGLQRGELLKERHEKWKSQLAEHALRAGIDLKRLPAKKSAPQKLLLVAAMKASSTATNIWLARELHTGSGQALSVHLRRWREKSENAKLLDVLLNLEA